MIPKSPAAWFISSLSRFAQPGGLRGWVETRAERDDAAKAGDLKQTADLASAMAARCPHAHAGFGAASDD